MAVYVWLNAWTVLPGILAIVVLILVRQSTYLAESCPPPSNIRVVAELHDNPLFCPPVMLIQTALQTALGDMHDALRAPWLTQSARSSAIKSAEAVDQAKARVAMADAVVKMATAEAGVVQPPQAGAAPPPKTPPRATAHRRARQKGTAAPAPAPVPGAPQAAPAQTPQQLVAQRTKEGAKAAFDAAEADLDKATDEAAARRQTLGQAAIFREARARLRWIASYAAVVVFAIGTIFAGIWITFSSLDDHLFPEETSLGEQRRVGVFAGLCLLIVASVWFLWWTWIAIYDASRTRLFADLPPASPFDIRLLRFQDAISTFIFGDGQGAGGVLLPVAQPMLEHANWLILFAIVALACAVSATLYQRPFQIVSLGRPRDPAEVAVALKDPKDPKPMPQQPYDRVLVRCFQRLNTCIYIGATLLVICVINISARYSWIAALLDPTETDEPWKSALPNAINGLAEELALQYGLGFTTLLLGLLVPTWVILRRRAWVVARLRNPGRDDVKSLQDFLASNGMGFTSVQKYAQVLAVLAPAGAGVFVTALKALTGAAS
jgi:hypothetical protein